MAKKEKKAGNKPGQQLAPAESTKAIAERTAKQPPKSKPTSAADRRKNRVEGIIKTVYPSVLGTIAGFACYHIALSLGDPWSIPFMGIAMPWYNAMIFVVAITFFIQKLTYPLLKIDVEQFKFKDWFYVEFMVVDLWLVTWTLLLN